MLSKNLTTALCLASIHAAFALEKIYGFSLLSLENVTEVNYTGAATNLPIRSMSTQTGDASFAFGHFFGLKTLKNDGFFHSYQLDLGYNTLNHNVFSAEFNDDTSPVTLKVQSGTYYGASTRFGIERGDYSLYAITGIRLTEWKVTAENSSNGPVMGLLPGGTEVFKKTSSAPMIGAGIHLVLTDRINALFEQLYLPTETNDRSTGADAHHWSNALTQHVTSISLIF